MEAYFISTDKSRLDIPMIHEFLSEQSYWAKGRSMETVKKSIDNSLCFGMYDEPGKQVGFARLVTDYVVFGWLMDVFILEKHRGKGLGKKLMQYIISYPDIQHLGRIGLGTEDAHSLYQQFGFTGLKKPANMMERLRIA